MTHKTTRASRDSREYGQGTHRIIPLAHNLNITRFACCLICHKEVQILQVPYITHLANHVRYGHMSRDESVEAMKSAGVWRDYDAARNADAIDFLDSVGETVK